MSDGITVSKDFISPTQELYGCELDDLPIDYDYEIKKHKVQIAKAKALSEKIYDRQSALGRRLVKVNAAVQWNELMLFNLRKGKK